MTFESAIGIHVQLNASLERALLDVGANLLTHIRSNVVNPSANGVIRAKLARFSFLLPIRSLFQPFFLHMA